MRHLAAPLLLCTLVSLCSPTAAQHTPSEDLHTQARSQQLQTHPTWRHLLEYPPGDTRSAVESDEFFLSPDGRHSPEAELRATLNAFFEPVGDNPNLHAQCRFPARLHWLKQQLPELATALPTLECHALDEWLQAEQLRSISVIMVSGDYGSAASSFGHALLKLNNGQQQLKRGLLDRGVNYGARAEPEDGLITYAYRGLFGNYRGGFTTEGFYRQDRVYARVQSRDLWEYELALDEAQTQLIALHLWELIGRELRYYFLRQNCAYHIARLLELGLAANLTGPALRPFPPMLLFQQLDEVNRERGGDVIRAVHAIPSPRRELSARFRALTPTQSRHAHAFIKHPSGEVLEMLPIEDQTRITDALLDYYDTLIAAHEDAPQDEWIAARQTVRRLRFALPPESEELIEVPPLDQAPPSEGTRPIRIGIGAVDNKAHGGSAVLQSTLFDNALLGRNSPLGSELTFGDLELRLDEDDDPSLHRLDLVRMQKLQHFQPAYPGDARLSWRFRAGVDQPDLGQTNQPEFFVRGGLGQAIKLRGFIAYTMLDGLLASRDTALAMQPLAGVLLGDPQRFAVAIESGYRFHPSGKDDAPEHSATAVLPIHRRVDVRMEWREHVESEAELVFSWHW